MIRKSFKDSEMKNVFYWNENRIKKNFHRNVKSAAYINSSMRICVNRNAEIDLMKINLNYSERWTLHAHSL
jgi:hypothetical protein